MTIHDPNPGFSDQDASRPEGAVIDAVKRFAVKAHVQGTEVIDFTESDTSLDEHLEPVVTADVVTPSSETRTTPKGISRWARIGLITVGGLTAVGILAPTVKGNFNESRSSNTTASSPASADLYTQSTHSEGYKLAHETPGCQATLAELGATTVWAASGVLDKRLDPSGNVEGSREALQGVLGNQFKEAGTLPSEVTQQQAREFELAIPWPACPGSPETLSETSANTNPAGE
jgi:hypothetical protein